MIAYTHVNGVMEIILLTIRNAPCILTHVGGENMALTLEERRKQRGSSYGQIAKETGIDKSSVYLHHKKHREPGCDHMARYARFYGCSMEAIHKGWSKTQEKTQGEGQ